MRRYYKDPDAVKDYTIDWANHPDGSWLASGETISTAVWTVPSGIVEDSNTSNDTTTCTLWLSGGTAGETYECTCRITTSDGRIDDRTIAIIVKEN